MFLSEKGRAQLKTQHGLNDFTKQLADLIANQAMSECAILDSVWIAYAPSTCAPQIKRRHKQFLGEVMLVVGSSPARECYSYFTT
ncbi:MAG: hypothetical protein H0U59_02185 [Gemmatimonadaceae bacterium]|nr:hypothetical protein [Gemmatimonadaceae bacterium]MDQ3242259.1 hypothetical protein [Gemmatimonadota bacterium]